MSEPVDWLPEVSLAPDHAPEAEQEVAFVEDQVSIDAPPLVTDVGFAAADTVGLVELPEDPGWLAPPLAPPPPQEITKLAIANNIRAVE